MVLRQGNESEKEGETYSRWFKITTKNTKSVLVYVKIALFLIII
jgi:hypothetical protein